VCHLWGRREYIQDFVRKYEGKKPLGRSSGRSKYNIKRNLNRMGRRALDFGWMKIVQMLQSGAHGWEPSVSIKSREFLC
jgi:hypothetical protein